MASRARLERASSCTRPKAYVVTAFHGRSHKRTNGDHFITSLGFITAPYEGPNLDELIQQQEPIQYQQQAQQQNVEPDFGGLNQAQMEDLLGESSDWDPEAMAAGMPLAASAGYTSDAIDPSAADRLGIMAEVEPLCRVVIAAAVKPPLSLGLFGDWGSGKSFFMAKMQGYIETLSDTARAEDSKTYCHEVVQIRFNAWHFADANLWASLAAHIFKELFEEIERKAARRESSAKAKATAKTASEKVRERLAGTARRRAQDTLDASQRELASARDQRIQATRAYVKALREGKSEVAQRLNGSLDKLERKFGLPAASDSLEDAISAGRQLRSFGGRLETVMRMFGRQPYLTLLIPVLLIAIALPFVIDFVARQFPDLFSSTSEILTKIGAMVSGVAAWIAGLVQRGSSYLGELEAVANDLEQAKLAGDAKAEPALGELNEAEAREQAALEQVAAAERKVVSAEQYDPGRELAELITARQGESSYERQLGIISEIRKDFEQMSELLAAQDAGEGGESRVDRIVLYIDDLDRCKPRRVVEILEAIHLLLSFPLFVVVVAVDPRWLRRCLQKIYPELLGRVVADDDEGELDPGTSTPQDYLEKIFQIPFALRPVEAAGFRGMMVDLMGEPAPARPKPPRPVVRVEPPRTASPAKKAPSFAPPTKPAPVEVTSSDEEPAQTEAPAQAPEVEPEQPDPAAVAADEAASAIEEEQRLVAIVSNARPLVFTTEEHDDILRLAPLFRAPRSVKRFVNIYRLVRVSVGRNEHESFIGTHDKPGEYRVALVLARGRDRLSQPRAALSSSALLVDSSALRVDWARLLVGPLRPDHRAARGRARRAGQEPPARRAAGQTRDSATQERGQPLARAWGSPAQERRGGWQAQLPAFRRGRAAKMGPADCSLLVFVQPPRARGRGENSTSCKRAVTRFTWRWFVARPHGQRAG